MKFFPGNTGKSPIFRKRKKKYEKEYENGMDAGFSERLITKEKMRFVSKKEENYHHDVCSDCKLDVAEAEPSFLKYSTMRSMLCEAHGYTFFSRNEASAMTSIRY